MNKISKNKIFVFIFSLLLFCPIVYFFSTLYVEGDQALYRQAYDLVQGLTFQEALSIYNFRIDGARFTHTFYYWVMGTARIDKDLAATFLNIVLFTYSFLYLQKIGANVFICLLILFTNYYFWILYSSAEALKLAFIFLILSLWHKDKIFISFIFAILALCSHLSLIFIYSGIVGAIIYTNFTKFKISYNSIIFLLISLICIYIFGEFYYISIIQKIKWYLNFNNVFVIKNYIPSLCLLITSMFYSKKIISTLILYSPSIIGIALMGPSRLNMLVFMMSLFYLVKKDGGNNLVFHILSIIMIYKTYIYLNSVYFSGHGFDN